MTLYVTNTSNCEMVPLDLSGLSRKPRGKVQRIQHYKPRARQTRYVRRASRSRPNPLNDLLLALSGFLVATAFIIAVLGPMRP